jgi:2-dehydropantoate 2-reductase
MKLERVLIWGIGAIGGTVGAHLARAGHNVTFVDRATDHVEAVRKHGILIRGPIANFTARAPTFTPQELTGQFDCVLLCVKSQVTRESALQLVKHLADDSMVISFQNGLCELVIAEVVGASRTMGCFINFGSDYIEPGVIHYGGHGAVVLGEIDGGLSSRLQTCVQMLRDFDPKFIPTQNIWGYLWAKQAYMSLLFSTSLTNMPIVDVFSSPVYREMLVKLAREVIRIAVKRNVKPESFDGFEPTVFQDGVPAEDGLASLDKLVAFHRKSEKQNSGIWRDMAVRKRKTEVDAILLPMIPMAKEVGVRTPILSRLIDLTHDIESGRRGFTTENLDFLLAASK